MQTRSPQSSPGPSSPPTYAETTKRLLHDVNHVKPNTNVTKTRSTTKCVLAKHACRKKKGGLPRTNENNEPADRERRLPAVRRSPPSIRKQGIHAAAGHTKPKGQGGNGEGRCGGTREFTRIRRGDAHLDCISGRGEHSLQLMYDDASGGPSKILLRTLKYAHNIIIPSTTNTTRNTT